MAQLDVFLTGATGYVGPAVLAALVRSGRRVTALVREKVDLAGAQTVVGQLGILGDAAEAVGNAGAVVHLASGRSIDRERVVFEDILGTAELLDAWRQGPFVQASTTTVHGIPRGILTPATPVDIVDWYDCGKAVNEFQLRSAVAGTVGTVGGRGPGISLRPTLFFGRSQRPPERQYLAWFLGHVIAGHALTFDSEQAMANIGAAYVGTEDFGRAVVAALDSSQSGAYPIAGGFVTWRDLLETINRVAGASGRWLVRPMGPQGPDEFRAGHSRTELDSSDFTARTGWRPQQGLDELVEAFVRGEREAGRA